jgi:hypothetical protein
VDREAEGADIVAAVVEEAVVEEVVNAAEAEEVGIAAAAAAAAAGVVVAVDAANAVAANVVTERGTFSDSLSKRGTTSIVPRLAFSGR